MVRPQKREGIGAGRAGFLEATELGISMGRWGCGLSGMEVHCAWCCREQRPGPETQD